MGQSRAGYFREYRARRAARAADGELLPFQSAFVSAVCREKRPPELAALSVPRGNGKSWPCGGLVARSLTPGDRLFEPNVENILVSASRSQAAIVLEFARAALGEVDGYRWRNDGVVHLDTRARVKVISSDSRRALGLGAIGAAHCGRRTGGVEPDGQGCASGTRLPGHLENGRTQVVAVGTLAPAPLTGPASWWPAFVSAGSGDGRHVSLLQGDPEKWENFDEVLKCKPGGLDQSALAAHARTRNTRRRCRVNVCLDPSDKTASISPASRWTRNRWSRRRSGRGSVHVRSRRARVSLSSVWMGTPSQASSGCSRASGTGSRRFS